MIDTPLAGTEFETIAGLLRLIAEVTRGLSNSPGLDRRKATSLAKEVEMIALRYDALACAKRLPDSSKQVFQ